MANQVFPTKGNLIATKKSLELAYLGYDLMDKKRNVLIKEMMSLLDDVKMIRDDITDSYQKAYYALQEANMSLKEIKAFMIQRNNQNFVNILREKSQELENEKKRIDNMQYRIQQAIQMTEYGMEMQHMVPFIEECEAEHLLTIAVPNKELTDREMMDYVSEHLEYCHSHHLTEELPLGTIIYQSQLLQKNYQENRYYVRLNQAFDDPRYWLKPQGMYATILHEGFYDTIDESFHI